MKILAIDTSGLVASVALLSDVRTIAEYTVNYKKTHSETLVPMLDEIKRMVGLDLSEIDAIAVAKGPGSFTGLRIGSATAKGLAFSLNIPIIEVPTVDALSYNAWGTDCYVCPIMDARRDQVYTGIYRFNGGEHEVVMRQCAKSIDDLCKTLDNIDGGKILFLGDGVPVYKEIIDETLKKEHMYAPLNMNMQRASSLGLLALDYVKVAQKAAGESSGIPLTDSISNGGGRIVSSADHKPEYLRATQAEREKLEKGKIHAREMVRDDVEAVSKIEEECFSMPWKPADFVEMIERDNMTYVVLCDEDKIIGGAGLRCLYDYNEITNVAITEQYRGKGYSKILLEYLMNKGRELGSRSFTLEVRVSNEPAIRLYKSAGFTESGIRPGFYEKPKEDALILWYK